MKNLKNAVVGIVTGFINGLFGAGGGLILVPSLTKISKLPQKKAMATSLAVILPLSILSVIIYTTKSSINWQILIPVVVGGLIGTPIGVYLLKIISSKILAKLFAVFMIVSAIRLIFF
ncbi:MAG: sulfite exporter TauE/SafE family protein [Clostridia bacterium]